MTKDEIITIYKKHPDILPGYPDFLAIEEWAQIPVQYAIDIAEARIMRFGIENKHRFKIIRLSHCKTKAISYVVDYVTWHPDPTVPHMQKMMRSHQTRTFPTILEALSETVTAIQEQQQ